MTRKFYSFLSSEEQKDFSLNFLLAENLTKQSSSINFYGIERKADNRSYACKLFEKHISRCMNVSEEDNYTKEFL